MSNKITAHSLDLQPSQKLDLPIGAELLAVNLDHRFNKCLLWTYEDEDADQTEEFMFTMAKLGDEDVTGKYIGTLKDNSGYFHVFAERPVKVPVPVTAVPSKPVHASVSLAKPVEAAR
jgi:hypothetical protein